MRNIVNKKVNLNFLKVFKNNKQILGLVALLVFIYIFISIINPKFLTLYNFQSIANQFPQYGLLSIAIMLTIISGGIDLSVISIANLAAIVAAVIMRSFIAEGASSGQAILVILISICAAIATGFVAGFINGTLITKVKIPAILATIGTMRLFMGISIVITGGEALQQLPTMYYRAGNYTLFDAIPIPMILFIVIVVMVSILLNRTTYGKKLYLIGTNETAAKFSGIDTNKIILKAYIYSGVIAAVVGLIMMARTNSAKADTGTEYLLQCVLIVVFGGVDPEGGYGGVGGVVVAILILQTISSAIGMVPAISNYYKLLIWGLVLLFVMVFQYVVRTRNKRRLLVLK